MYNNTGYNIAAVAKAGSIGKHTNIQRSDLDVIFCLSPDEHRGDVYPIMIDQLISCFGNIASINQGDAALHIDFINPEVKIDLVLLYQHIFDRDFEAICDIRQLNQIQLDAIKLVKYSVYENNLEEIIPAYRIEQIGFNLEGFSLARTTELIIQQLNTSRRNKINILSTLSTH